MKSWRTEKRSFEGNLSAGGFIQRYLSKPERGLFPCNPPINFSRRTHLHRKGKNGSYRYVHSALAGDVNNKRKLLGLLNFIYTVIAGNVDRLSCQLCSVNDPRALRRKLKHGFFLNVFAIVFFEKITADELTILHKNA